MSDSSSAAPRSPSANPALPVDLRPIIPSLDYYRDRNADFLRRHPALQPPDYYLGYGDRYLHVFMQQIRPRLTPPGQGFVDRAFSALQNAIEDKRAQDPMAFDALE